jgi:hypothetical protein
MAGLFAAVAATLPPRPPGGGPFMLSQPGRLAELLVGARLRPVAEGATECEFAYADGATCWRAQASAGPLQAAIRAVGVDAVRAAVAAAVAPFTDAAGAVVLRNTFVWVVGEKPAAG